MNLSRTFRTLSLAGVAAMSSPFAIAADSGWYIGANAGQSNARFDTARINDALVAAGSTSSSIEEDDRDTGYKLFGGYKLNRNLAFEGGYFDLGKFNFTSTTVPSGTLSGTIKVRGVNLDAVGMLPFSDRFSGFGRVGVQYAEAKDSFAGTGAVTVSNPNPSESEANYKLGLGVQYDFTKSVGMRGEWERYRINDGLGNPGDIDLYSIGVVFMFSGNKAVAARPAHVAAAPVAVAPATKRAAPAPAIEKIIVTADTLFDFDKSAIKPAGKDTLDKLVAKLEGNLRVVISTGFTSSSGSDDYNMKLSLRRTEAVKAYLVSRGVDGNRIYTSGKGEHDPVSDNKTAAGRAENRRVEIEVMATPK